MTTIQVEVELDEVAAQLREMAESGKRDEQFQMFLESLGGEMKEFDYYHLPTFLEQPVGAKTVLGLLAEVVRHDPTVRESIRLEVAELNEAMK